MQVCERIVDGRCVLLASNNADNYVLIEVLLHTHIMINFDWKIHFPEEAIL